MSRKTQVDRPLKKAEYVIVFATRQAERGWRDCLATAKNATVDAWDRLTTTPCIEDRRCYKLKDNLAVGTYQGQSFQRYQYKITDSGRIWYFVDSTPSDKTRGRVLLERCETGHPKETE